MSVELSPKARAKLASLEKANQALQNQIELLETELSHKTEILGKVERDKSDLQTQYKEVLQKLVEMSEKTPGNGLTFEDERYYRTQLKEQSLCIATLENRLWEAEHQNRIFRVHGHKCSSGKSSELEKENEQWRLFARQVYGLISSRFDDYEHFFDAPPDAQRTIALDLLRDYVQGQRRSDHRQTNHEMHRGKSEKSHHFHTQHELQIDQSSKLARKEKLDCSEAFESRLQALTRVAKDLKGDYHRLLQDHGKGDAWSSCSIESLSELNHSY
jgi:septal ring factor EnvC (AmiA/AmiB activator)